MVALISIHYKLINQSFPKVDTDSNSINHNRSEMSGSSSLQIYESFYFDKNGLQSINSIQLKVLITNIKIE